MLDGHFPSLEVQVLQCSSLGMLQTKSYYTPIILDLNSRAIIHKLSEKLSPSRRDMQALSQVSLKISLESSIHSTVHLHRPRGKEGRVESQVGNIRGPTPK